MRCCRPGELVSTASSDELFLVLKMLLESIHGFLHQPSTLDARHVIHVHRFLNDDAGPLQQGSGLLLLLRTSDDLRPQQVALGLELRIISFRCRMTPVACSIEAFMLSCNLAQLEI